MTTPTSDASSDQAWAGAQAPTPPAPSEASGEPQRQRFVDRRKRDAPCSHDRRQFGSSHDDLSGDARELAMAIDGYKARHRRRYINFEEMLGIVRQLGYHRKGECPELNESDEAVR